MAREIRVSASSGITRNITTAITPKTTRRVTAKLTGRRSRSFRLRGSPGPAEEQLFEKAEGDVEDKSDAQADEERGKQDK